MRARQSVHPRQIHQAGAKIFEAHLLDVHQLIEGGPLGEGGLHRDLDLVEAHRFGCESPGPKDIAPTDHARSKWWLVLDAMLIVATIAFSVRVLLSSDSLLGTLAGCSQTYERHYFQGSSSRHKRYLRECLEHCGESPPK